MPELPAQPERRETVRWLRPEVLLLDPANPRLEDEHLGSSQEDLGRLLDELYDAREIAASIARFGYFPSEVIVGVENPDGTVTIVEGNRRLTAVKGLIDEGMRARLRGTAEWDRLAAQAASTGHVPRELPVIVASSRDEVVATIGYRHISGIKQWEPYQQARYVADRIDSDALSIREVSQQTGITDTQIRNKYRNYGIVKAAAAAGLDAALIQESFGVWDAALGRVALRRHIGAPDPAGVVPGEPVVPADKLENLHELVEWIFGERRVITDSRQLAQLSDVVGSERGLASLRDGRTLEESLDAMRAPTSPTAKMVQLLTTSSNALRLARDYLTGADPAEYDLLARSPEVQVLVSEVQSSLESISGQLEQ